MLLDVVLLTVGALGVVIAALSARIRPLPISEPLVALVVGMLLGPAVLDLLRVEPITSATRPSTRRPGCCSRSR